MESSLTSRQWEFEPPSIYSMVSKARLASQERDRIKMPWAHKTFARTDAPREATCSTSEPISQLDERAWKQSGYSLLYFAHKKSDRKKNMDWALKTRVFRLKLAKI